MLPLHHLAISISPLYHRQTAVSSLFYFFIK